MSTILFIFYCFVLADVFGTLEALMKIIKAYNDNRCPLDLVDAGVGAVSADDLEIAQMFGGKKQESS